MTDKCKLDEMLVLAANVVGASSDDLRRAVVRFWYSYWSPSTSHEIRCRLWEDRSAMEFVSSVGMTVPGLMVAAAPPFIVPVSEPLPEEKT